MRLVALLIIRDVHRYSGYYAPPYGPQGFVLGGPNRNSFQDSDNGESLSQSISALRDFHLSRLRVYAEDETTWRAIDWIMFETIPLLREGQAIRLAVESLYRELGDRYSDSDDSWWRKPYWTSFVFPDGKAPDGSSVGEIVQMMFDSETAQTVYPSAIGINCTSPAYIRGLTEQMSQCMADILEEASETDLIRQHPPAFVLYPDGGLVYDVVTRTWHAPRNAPSVDGPANGEGSWAKNVGQVARWAAEQKYAGRQGSQPVWRQVLVGGCCKSGYAEIAGLRKELQ